MFRSTVRERTPLACKPSKLEVWLARAGRTCAVCVGCCGDKHSHDAKVANSAVHWSFIRCYSYHYRVMSCRVCLDTILRGRSLLSVVEHYYLSCTGVILTGRLVRRIRPISALRRRQLVNDALLNVNTEVDSSCSCSWWRILSPRCFRYPAVVPTEQNNCRRIMPSFGGRRRSQSAGMSGKYARDGELECSEQ